MRLMTMRTNRRIPMSSKDTTPSCAPNADSLFLEPRSQALGITQNLYVATTNLSSIMHQLHRRARCMRQDRLPWPPAANRANLPNLIRHIIYRDARQVRTRAQLRLRLKDQRRAPTPAPSPNLFTPTLRRRHRRNRPVPIIIIMMS